MQDPTIIQQDIKRINANQVKAKGFRNTHHANNKHKTTGVAALIERKTKILQDKSTNTRKIISKTSKDHFNKKI